MSACLKWDGEKRKTNKKNKQKKRTQKAYLESQKALNPFYFGHVELSVRGAVFNLR